MKNVDNLKLKLNSTLKDALTTISNGAIKVALIVDKKDKLLGTLTDGDIRRGLLSGLNVNSSINSIVSKNPIVAKITHSKDEILKIALSKKLHQIPIVDQKGKILSISVIDELIQPKEKNNKVVLMVGGTGKRLMPLTQDNPKPMLKIAGKPILLDIIEKFANCGYKNIVMCANYKSHIIQNYFKDGSKFGVNIEYIIEEKKLGTAGALSLIVGKFKEPFFVMNGDLLTTLDFNKMLDFHLHYKSKATMAVREYNLEVPYGVVNMNKENVLSIDEKPKYNFFVNAGIYILDPYCIGLIPKNKNFDMPSLFNKIVIKKKKTVCFPIQENWLDIGKLNDYQRAQDEYLKAF